MKGSIWRLGLLALGLALPALGAEEQLLFLPSHPAFDRLIGDPREPQFALLTNLTYPKFEGSIGPTLEFLQWRPKDGTQWGWGIWGGSFIELDSVGHFAYPERVSDWYLGMYFSETAGAFSNRLDYTHVSSHLGDELFLYTYHFIYTRESFRWTTSFTPSDHVRLYAGAGYSPHIAPLEKAFFLHAGVELYGDYFPFLLGTMGRGYFTYDLKVKDEAGSVTNQNFQLGFQWKGKKDDASGVRLALTYYNGNSEYGQFYEIPDNHWGLAAFFDP